MKDIHFRGRCLRIFWRGPEFPWLRPYGWFNWGFYAFGVGPLGFMFWPKESLEVPR